MQSLPRPAGAQRIVQAGQEGVVRGSEAEAKGGKKTLRASATTAAERPGNWEKRGKQRLAKSGWSAVESQVGGSGANRIPKGNASLGQAVQSNRGLCGVPGTVSGSAKLRRARRIDPSSFAGGKRGALAECSRQGRLPSPTHGGIRWRSHVTGRRSLQVPSRRNRARRRSGRGSSAEYPLAAARHHHRATWIRNRSPHSETDYGRRVGSARFSMSRLNAEGFYNWEPMTTFPRNVS